MPLSDYIPGWDPDPYDTLVEGLDKALGDGDAIALLPYDDGTLYPKRAYFDKNLIGGIGGFETEDGDKIAVDGTGEAVRSLFGVDIVLGVDPTEHAAAVDPIKALIAHKADIGEWIRVDRKEQVVQIGPALEPAPVFVEAETVDEAMETASFDELLALIFDEYDPEGYDDEEKAALFEEHHDDIWDAVETTMRLSQTPQVSPEGIVADGGMVAEYVEQARQADRSVSFDEALAELRQRGDVSTLYDIAPPSGMYVDSEGEVQFEEATHIAVDQSKAAELLPKKWDTVKLNTMIDKARMEEYEEGKLMKYLIYGIIIGSILVASVGILFFLVFSVSGGVFG